VNGSFDSGTATLLASFCFCLISFFFCIAARDNPDTELPKKGFSMRIDTLGVVSGIGMVSSLTLD
jgi:hypothetical protein